jgi:hypothetical protein
MSGFWAGFAEGEAAALTLLILALDVIIAWTSRRPS